MKNQFGLFSRALDIGLACIPVEAATAQPQVDSYAHLATRLPTASEADYWDAQFPVGDRYGIALVCGPASGIIAIDDDTANPELKNIIPQSVYSKRGLPGRCTGFFKYREGVANIAEGKTGVRIQAFNSFTILPPSKHRKFDGHYLWIGKSLFDLDRDELPDFPSLGWMASLPNGEAVEGAPQEGRNNYLKKVIAAKRFDGCLDKQLNKQRNDRHHRRRRQ